MQKTGFTLITMTFFRIQYCFALHDNICLKNWKIKHAVFISIQSNFWVPLKCWENSIEKALVILQYLWLFFFWGDMNLTNEFIGHFKSFSRNRTWLCKVWCKKFTVLTWTKNWRKTLTLNCKCENKL